MMFIFSCYKDVLEVEWLWFDLWSVIDVSQRMFLFIFKEIFNLIKIKMVRADDWSILQDKV